MARTTSSLALEPKFTTEMVEFSIGPRLYNGRRIRQGLIASPLRSFPLNFPEACVAGSSVGGSKTGGRLSPTRHSRSGAPAGATAAAGAAFSPLRIVRCARSSEARNQPPHAPFAAFRAGDFVLIVRVADDALEGRAALGAAIFAQRHQSLQLPVSHFFRNTSASSGVRTKSKPVSTKGGYCFLFTTMS